MEVPMDTRFSNGYVFRMQDNCPLVGVEGLLGVTVTYTGSPVTETDIVVCPTCWQEWIATPPWNDTPPTLKPPPTCHHLEETEESTR